MHKSEVVEDHLKQLFALDEIPEGLWEVDFLLKQVREKNLILLAAHGQLEKTNLGWSDLAFGMSSGASAVYGWIVSLS